MGGLGEWGDFGSRGCRDGLYGFPSLGVLWYWGLLGF